MGKRKHSGSKCTMQAHKIVEKPSNWDINPSFISYGTPSTWFNMSKKLGVTLGKSTMTLIQVGMALALQDKNNWIPGSSVKRFWETPQIEVANILNLLSICSLEYRFAPTTDAYYTADKYCEKFIARAVAETNGKYRWDADIMNSSDEFRTMIQIDNIAISPCEHVTNGQCWIYTPLITLFWGYYIGVIPYEIVKTVVDITMTTGVYMYPFVQGYIFSDNVTVKLVNAIKDEDIDEILRLGRNKLYPSSPFATAFRSRLFKSWWKGLDNAVKTAVVTMVNEHPAHNFDMNYISDDYGSYADELALSRFACCRVLMHDITTACTDTGLVDGLIAEAQSNLHHGMSEREFCNTMLSKSLVNKLNAWLPDVISKFDARTPDLPDVFDDTDSVHLIRKEFWYHTCPREGDLQWADELRKLGIVCRNNSLYKSDWGMNLVSIRNFEHFGGVVTSASVKINQAYVTYREELAHKKLVLERDTLSASKQTLMKQLRSAEKQSKRVNMQAEQDRKQIANLKSRLSSAVSDARSEFETYKSSTQGIAAENERLRRANSKLISRCESLETKVSSLECINASKKSDEIDKEYILELEARLSEQDNANEIWSADNLSDSDRKLMLECNITFCIPEGISFDSLKSWFPNSTFLTMKFGSSSLSISPNSDGVVHCAVRSPHGMTYNLRNQLGCKSYQLLTSLASGQQSLAYEALKHCKILRERYAN